MKISFGKKKIKITDYKECRGIHKYIGLMFSSKSAKIRVFPFDAPTSTPIHSLFCPDFLAVWIKKGKVIETKIIKDVELSIKPSTLFDTLIEIPLNKHNSNLLKMLNVSTVE